MKKIVMTLSFLLVALMVLMPAAATLAHAWGSGAGAAGGAGAAADASGGGAPAGGAPAGGAAAGGTGAPSGGSDGGPASSSGSPSGSPWIGASPGGDDTGAAAAAPATYRRLKSDKKVKKDAQEVSPSASVATGDFVGRHTMTGTVAKVNPDKGTFRLKTSEGTFDLHAPPSALAGVQKGDRMNVEIAVQPLR